MHRCVWLLLAVAGWASAQDATFRSDVRLVNVAFTARDASGKLVTDLRKEEIEVTEDGAEQKPEVFLKSGDVPLSLGLVIDASGSQSSFVKQQHKDVRAFLRTVLAPRDRAFIVGFASHVRLVADFHNDSEALVNQLAEYEEKPRSKPDIGRKIERSLGTGFYDAIYLSTREKLAAADRGRRALIVFSDGEDNASQYHMLDVIQEAQLEDVVLFSVHYATFKGEPNARNLYGARVMERLAADTGGAYFDAVKKDLRPAFKEIEETLRSSYELAYRSTNAAAGDATFRKIRIRTTRPGVTIRHRSGYFPR